MQIVLLYLFTYQGRLVQRWFNAESMLKLKLLFLRWDSFFVPWIYTQNKLYNNEKIFQKNILIYTYKPSSLKILN